MVMLSPTRLCKSSAACHPSMISRGAVGPYGRPATTCTPKGAKAEGATPISKKTG